MNPAEIIDKAKSVGVVLTTDGHRLEYDGPDRAVDELIDILRQHKTELIAELTTPTCQSCRAYDGGRCFAFVYATGKSGKPDTTAADRPGCKLFKRRRQEGADSAGLVCFCCKGRDFWRTLQGDYRCRRCHPPVEADAPKSNRKNPERMTYRGGQFRPDDFEGVTPADDIPY